jgi:hypothetical protein
MPNHLSILGIIHTAISVIAIIFAIVALFRDGKINPANGTGKLYVLLTVLTCLTALPIMKTGHLTAAHYVAITVLILLPIGVYSRRIFGKASHYLQIIVMSTTLFFSFIPAIVETLTRLPISQPLADGPNAPIIQTGLMVLVILYVAGVIYQLIKLRIKRKSTQKADPTIKFS